MIDAFSIRINELPFVSLEDKQQLPETSGIYFILSDLHGLIYIGASTNIRNRWMHPDRLYECQKYRLLSDIRIAWLEVPCFTKLEVLEREMIKHFCPLRNGPGGVMRLHKLIEETTGVKVHEAKLVKKRIRKAVFYQENL